MTLARTHGRASTGLTAAVPFYYGWLIVAAAALGMFATGPGQTFTVAVFVDPIGAALGLSKTAVSTAYTIAGTAAALVVLQVGRLIDRYGIRRSMIGAAILLGLACIGMSTVQGMVGLVIGFAALRILGPGTLSLTSTVLPTRWFVRRRGLALGLVALGMALSHAVLPTAAGALIDAVGWRGAWLGLAFIASLLVLVPAIFVVRERPEDVGLRPDGEPERGRPGSRQAGESRRDWTFRRAAGTPSFWILMIIGVTQSAVGTGIIFHQVSYFAEQGLLDYLPVVFATFAVAQTASMTLTGVVLDRVAAHLVLTVLQALLAAGIGLMLALQVVPAAVPVYAVMLGIAMGGMGTLSSVIWPAFYGTRHLATLRSVESGVKMTAAAVGPLPLALAFDYLGGYAPGLVLFGLLTAISAALGFACRPPRAPVARAASGPDGTPP